MVFLSNLTLYFQDNLYGYFNYRCFIFFKNKKFLFPFLVFGAILISSSCQNPTLTANQQERPPNVLLILTDDQGWGDLAYHGNDSISTPHLDALAKKSNRFNRFYVSPVCAPTRASLLTGRYHLRTGTSWVTHRKEVMRAEETTIAEVFKTAGYSTGCFGKWHNGEQYPNNPNGQGFDEFFGFTAGHWNNYFDTKLTHNGKTVKTEGYITDVFTDKAIDFIHQNKEKPFLCYVPYNAPHSPFQVPDKYFDKYKKIGLTDRNASVHGMVENIDDNVGRLMSTLDSLQLTGKTIVIFFTDNGPNGRRYNGGMKGWKGRVNEGGVRVPCFLSWPNHLPENQDIQPLAAHIDLLPTLADLCKIELPNDLSLDGKSLVPLLQNPNTEWQERPIYTIHSEGKMRMYPGAMRTDHYRLIHNRQQQYELYDMQNDPAEKKDLAATLPDLLDSLKTNYESWFKDATQSGISVPPVPVGFAESPHTFLPAPEAQLSGNVKFQGKMGWANDYIVNWTAKNDAATWDIEVENSGDYEIVVYYNADEATVGSVLSIGVIDENDELISKNVIKIQEAFWAEFLESPDRLKRGEVYEKEWGKLNMEQVKLEKGKVRLRLMLEEMKNGGILEIKGISTLEAK